MLNMSECLFRKCVSIDSLRFLELWEHNHTEDVMPKLESIDFLKTVYSMFYQIEGRNGLLNSLGLRCCSGFGFS